MDPFWKKHHTKNVFEDSCIAFYGSQYYICIIKIIKFLSLYSAGSNSPSATCCWIASLTFSQGTEGCWMTFGFSASKLKVFPWKQREIFKSSCTCWSEQHWLGNHLCHNCSSLSLPSIGKLIIINISNHKVTSDSSDWSFVDVVTLIPWLVWQNHHWFTDDITWCGAVSAYKWQLGL